MNGQKRLSSVGERGRPVAKSRTRKTQKVKTQISKSSFGSAFVAMALLSVAFSFVSAQTANENQSAQANIVGAWRTAVTPVDCVTGGELAPPFPGLFTFHKGGTMSEYGIGPGQTPALRSPGHGVWKREDGRNYSFTFTFYRYDTAGIFLGTQKITAALEVGTSGADFTTDSTIEIFDANGNLIATACGVAVGTRFE
jgi:hypothetical protein